MGNYTAIKSEAQVYTVVYYDDDTFSPTRDTNVVIAGENTVLTLGNTAPYDGFTIPISAHVDENEWVYLIVPYKNSNYCIALSHMDRVSFEFYNGSWTLQDGNELTLTSAAVTNAPSGYLPNDWRQNLSASNISFVYFGINTTTYGIPDSDITISVKRWGNYGSAEATETVTSTSLPRQWINRIENGSWLTDWVEVLTPSSIQTITNKTIDFNDNKILNTPVIVNESKTVNPINKEMYLKIVGDRLTIKLANPYYDGYRLPILATGVANNLVINLQGTNQCITIDNGEHIVLYYYAGSWSIESNTTLYADQYTVYFAPYINPSDTSQGKYIPNDWRNYCGKGNYTFLYNDTNGVSDYGLPGSGYVTVNVISYSATRATAQATRWNDTTHSSETWVVNKQDVWGTWAKLADDSNVVHLDGNEEITGLKDFSYGHGAAQDEAHPAVTAARLRISGQVASNPQDKSVSQVDFYLGSDAIGYMGCTKQGSNSYLKVAASGNTTPLILGYLPYQDNTACLRFEKNKPVWRGGQTGTYSADKAVAVVGDIKDGSYELKNKTIDYGYVLDGNNNEVGNTLKCTPKVISTSQTLDFTKETSIIVESDQNVVITLGGAPYKGFKVPIFHNTAGQVSVKFTNYGWQTTIVTLPGQQVTTFIYCYGRWKPQSGTTFFTDTNTVQTIDNILVNDWRKLLGEGIYSYGYVNCDQATYGLPSNYYAQTISTRSDSWQIIEAVAEEMGHGVMYEQNYWRNPGVWYKFSSDEVATTLKNKTINAADNTLPNITNCITQIPQDIKAEISGSNFVLKSGSKVYIPNGKSGSTSQYSNITTDSDVSLSFSSSLTITAVVYRSPNGTLSYIDITTTYSGTTDPGNNSLWYDTTNNNIRRKSGSGAETDGCSFPIAIVKLSSGTPTEITQIFNGFGYIGSTCFVLPGVKGLRPEGRNSDGTPKSGSWTIPQVYINTLNSGAGIRQICTDGYSLSTLSMGWYYDEKINYITGGGANLNTTILALISVDSSNNYKVTDFKPNTVFHATDYNELKQAFWVTHGVTTHTEIDMAWEQNKVILMKYNGFIYRCSRRASSFYFYVIEGETCHNTVVSTSNQWTDWDIPYTTPTASQELKNKTINADNNTLINVLTNKNITNCVTEIPQNIKLECVNGVLTLKSGSKVYKPIGKSSGTPQFELVSIDTDRTLSSSTGTGTYMIYAAGGGIGWRTITTCNSGTTDPGTTGTTFYDTDDNIIIAHNNSEDVQVSFPFAIVTTSSGSVISIDTIFNGIGYIGSVIFALPGLKAQYCVGYWTNGNPKSNVVTIGNVITYDFSSAFNTTSWSGRKFRVRIWSTDHMDCLADTHYTDDEHVPSNFGGVCYDKAENRMHWYNNGVKGGYNYSADVADFLVTITASKITISNFNPHQILLPGATDDKFIPEEVWVTYNFTSFAEVDEYAKLGKRVMTKYGAYSYELTTANASTATSYYFTAIKAGSYQVLTISNSNTWSASSYPIVSTENTLTLKNKEISILYNTIKTETTAARTATTITFPNNKLIKLQFDNASTSGPYTISDAPYAGYDLHIIVTVAAANNNRAVITFKGVSGNNVTKTLSAGSHHLVGADNLYWTYNEFAFTDDNNNSYTYLL